MASIITNLAAMQALQSASGASADLALRQKRISTGLAVAGTKDDSAAFVVAQSLRGDSASWQAIGTNISRARSILDVATSGAEQIDDVLNQLKSKAYELASDLDDSSRDAIQSDMEALVAQIETISGSAEMLGVNLLRHKPSLVTTTVQRYQFPDTTLPPPISTPMSALPPGSAARDLTTSYVYYPPKPPLTPASFGPAAAQIIGSDSTIASLDAGPNAGEIALSVDALNAPGAIEIWQNGVRVAASGQPDGADGAPVGPGVALSGATLRFDYDPAKGQNIEIRANPGGPVGTSWDVTHFDLTNPDQPAPPPITYWRPGGQTEIVAGATPPFATVSPEIAAEALNAPTENLNTDYVVDGGTHAGRMDIVFEAYDLPDTMEIWQNGIRVGATGQSYTTGGGPVGAASEVTGTAMVSFDYDPADGPLTFRFNGASQQEFGGWAVVASSLSPVGTPLALPTKVKIDNQGPGATPQLLTVTTNLSNDQKRTFSRNLSAAGLGLDPLDWADPGSIMDAIGAAQGQLDSTLSYFGTRTRAFDSSAALNSKMIDTIDASVGRMVDADLAKESARLQAAQVKQQLATQALAIANAEPKWMLSLFQ